MKRAIFQPANIELNIEHELFSTPIGPNRLPFHVGEEMFVAIPRRETPAGIGEYQFLYTIGEYRGSRPDVAEQLFGRPGWRHLYVVAGVREIEPFALEDVAAVAGADAGAVKELYRGQTQHHRIVRTIQQPHEAYFRRLLRLPGAGIPSGYTVVRRNRLRAVELRIRALSPDDVTARLIEMDRQNSGLGAGKQYRSGRSQRRNQTFVALLKAHYDDRCQVCGDRISGPGGARADVHHLSPRDGDRSDRLDNVIVVCPNDHARFELGALRWGSDGLAAWSAAGGWCSKELVVDKHLLVKLGVGPTS